jgi:hypothetical protein
VASIHWKRWTDFTTDFHHDPYLASLPGDDYAQERTNLFLAFAVAVRSGRWHRGRRPGADAVETTLRETAKILIDLGLNDPRKLHPAATTLHPRLSKLISRYRDEDPPPNFQLALPATVFIWIVTFLSCSSDAFVAATADLIVIAYFYLLRVGEYTATPKRARGTRRRTPRTVPLRKCDIVLYHHDTVINHDAPWATLAACTGATITLENQKNGHRNCHVYHTTSGTILNPVQAIARRLHHLQGTHPHTPISTVRYDNQPPRQVRAQDIRSTIRLAAAKTNLPSCGYDLRRIGSHSIRASGALALELAGYSSTLIQTIGRWSSRTYLKYIHPQIDRLTIGVSQRMAVPRSFRNISFRNQPVHR